MNTTKKQTAGSESAATDKKTEQTPAGSHHKDDKTTKEHFSHNQKKEDEEKMTTKNQTEAETAEAEAKTAEKEKETAQPPDTKFNEVNSIVKNRTIASVGAGLIPLPAVDFIALTGIQMETVRALSKLYGVKFSKNLGKTAITSLTAGLFPVSASPMIGSFTKTIPGIGQLAGVATMPVLSGATTYAIGKVFIQHFESGGNFLTFDPEKVKDHFRQEFEKGKEFAKGEANSKA